MKNSQIEAIYHLVENDFPLDKQITCLRELRLDILSVDTVIESVNIFRQKMIAVNLPNKNAVDLSGTGGDKSNSFNISTTASLVAASAGMPIAKHGNVSISSKSGGIDLLRVLNLPIPENKDDAVRDFEKNGIVFFFAQVFHPIFKEFILARKFLADEGVITLFNILGPLLNPAETTCSVNGVFREDLVKLVAEVKLATGTKRSLIVYGDGMDEFSLTGDNKIAEIKDGQIFYSVKSAEDFGMDKCTSEDIIGGSPQENSEITKGVFDGSITGAKKDIVVLNAAAAIYVGLDDIDFCGAIKIAKNAIESRKANDLLQRLAP